MIVNFAFFPFYTDTKRVMENYKVHLRNKLQKSNIIEHEKTKVPKCSSLRLAGDGKINVSSGCCLWIIIKLFTVLFRRSALTLSCVFQYLRVTKCIKSIGYREHRCAAAASERKLGENPVLCGRHYNILPRILLGSISECT